MTLGQLRKLIEGLPDETPVYLGGKGEWYVRKPSGGRVIAHLITVTEASARMATDPNDKIHTGLVIQT